MLKALLKKFAFYPVEFALAYIRSAIAYRHMSLRLHTCDVTHWLTPCQKHIHIQEYGINIETWGYLLCQLLNSKYDLLATLFIYCNINICQIIINTKYQSLVWKIFIQLNSFLNNYGRNVLIIHFYCITSSVNY